ncbi:MAG: hypothetical protein VXY77_01585 [Pseudomonadota bacterium]|nr:hypothetical protein [Pseudomonadota bacterium]
MKKQADVGPIFSALIRSSMDQNATVPSKHIVLQSGQCDHDSLIASNFTLPESELSSSPQAMFARWHRTSPPIPMTLSDNEEASLENGRHGPDYRRIGFSLIKP